MQEQVIATVIGGLICFGAGVGSESGRIANSAGRQCNLPESKESNCPIADGSQ